VVLSRDPGAKADAGSPGPSDDRADLAGATEG
jgi:hypothetical protein